MNDYCVTIKCNKHNLLKMHQQSFHEILPYLYIGDCSTFICSMIVNCTKEDEVAFPECDSICIRIPVRDHPCESGLLLSYMKETDVLEKIHTQLKNNKTVLVHCSRGMQRSCAVVSCYLIRYHNMTAKSAIDFIKSKKHIEV